MSEQQFETFIKLQRQLQRLEVAIELYNRISDKFDRSDLQASPGTSALSMGLTSLDHYKGSRPTSSAQSKHLSQAPEDPFPQHVVACNAICGCEGTHLTFAGRKLFAPVFQLSQAFEVVLSSQISHMSRVQHCGMAGPQ